MKMIRRRALSALVPLLAAWGMPSLVHGQAQPWPNKPVKIVVPFPPGGAIDSMIRAMAPSLHTALGQPIVIENRPGAGGVLGTESVLRANDGHTLLMTAMGHTIYPELNSHLAFDPVADFKAIAPIAVVPNVVIVPANSPFSTLEDLMAFAKSNPGKLTYGSAGNGTSLHLTAALFTQMAGIKMQHVPYKGSAPALTDLVAGRIDMMFDSSTSASPFMASNRVKALAVASTERSALLPGLPTIAESGVRDYKIHWWYGLLAPANLPDDAADKVSKAVLAALDDPEIVARFATIRVEPMKMGRPAFSELIRKDRREWKARIAALGITPG
jgi:tripartite-type tricarboxylate transporter receptor subunit TctC